MDILGLELDGPVPAGFTPLEAVVILTGLDADGRPDVVTRATAGLPTYAAIGLLTTTSDLLRHGLLDQED